MNKDIITRDAKKKKKKKLGNREPFSFILQREEQDDEDTEGTRAP